MTNKLEALSPAQHAALNFTSKVDFTFAQTLVAAPLGAEELGEASKHFPLVFTAEDSPVPYALFGLKGKNAFVNKSGQWRSRSYVPAYLRAYPFVAATTDQPDSFAILIDRAAPQFAGNEGEPLFDNAGQPGPALARARDFLIHLQASLKAAKVISAPLADAGILVPVVLTERNGKAAGLPSVRIVDSAKFAALPEQTLLAWSKSGLLSLVVLHLNSLSNLGWIKPEAATEE